MNTIEQVLTKYNKPLFILLFAICLFPFISPAIALFLGLALGMTAGQPFPKFSKKTSKYLLQFSVVGLGFGMNLHESLKTGKECFSPLYRWQLYWCWVYIWANA